MFPLNFLPEIPVGPLTFVVLAAVVIGSSVPVFSIVIAAEPILVAVILATDHDLSVPELLAVAIGAAVVGDMVSYWLGRTLGPRLLKTRIVRRSRKHVYGAHHSVQRRGVLGAMIVQRWVPPARGFVPASLGTARRPFGRFVGYSVIASAVWALVLVLGTHFGGPTLMLVIPAVITVFLVIQGVRRLVIWWGNRRDARVAATER
ncbi:DedA family protein [Mycobacterium hackensackense]|uniref:DedA family protein n=1 Tax=Mycobacterium hackensackense TaxID=228909 RepID=UPI002265C693|nr:DedA family protein [Mycobacterium hackensackense]MCV7254177.1 DedA family protein [Mycobacterium hackensackense]